MTRAFSWPSPRRGLWAIVAAATSWGTTGVASQLIYRISSTNALSIAFLRLGIAALILVPLCWPLIRRRAWRVSGRDGLLMLAMGAMQAAAQFGYLAAIPEAGVTIATLLSICLAPVIVALVARFMLRERVTRAVLIALLCAVAGMALLTGTPSDTAVHGRLPVGVALSLMTAIAYAFVILLGRILSQRIQPVQVNATAFGSAAIILLACSLSSHLSLRYPVGGWLLLIYLGCVPTALGYLLFQVGMRSTTATLTSIVTFCEPLTAAVLAWLVFGERLGPLSIVGAALLLGAMGLLTLRPSAPPLPATSSQAE
jgi:drug/metabolite transporter, DME family